MTIGGKARELPIAIVAERRRLREIELRVYYSPEAGTDGTKATRGRSRRWAPSSRSRTSSIRSSRASARAPSSRRSRASRRAPAWSIRRAARTARPTARWGASSPSSASSRCEVGGSADDGRTVCVEANVTRGRREVVPGSALVRARRQRPHSRAARLLGLTARARQVTPASRRPRRASRSTSRT